MVEQLAQIAQREFSDRVVGHVILGRRASAPLKLRLHVRDGTFIDSWLSPDQQRYAYHWEQRAVRGSIHRHDNAPDHPHISTFPKHFHNGSDSPQNCAHLNRPL
jgi:hypothetical protein